MNFLMSCFTKSKASRKRMAARTCETTAAETLEIRCVASGTVLSIGSIKQSIQELRDARSQQDSTQGYGNPAMQARNLSTGNSRIDRLSSSTPAKVVVSSQPVLTSKLTNLLSSSSKQKFPTPSSGFTRFTTPRNSSVKINVGRVLNQPQQFGVTSGLSRYQQLRAKLNEPGGHRLTETNPSRFFGLHSPSYYGYHSPYASYYSRYYR